VGEIVTDGTITTPITIRINATNLSAAVAATLVRMSTLSAKLAERVGFDYVPQSTTAFLNASLVAA
jgi:hypothetical protein